MLFVEQEALLDLLHETRKASETIIAQVDLSLTIDGWRIADYLQHLTTWEYHTTQCLLAYGANETYHEPMLVDVCSNHTPSVILEQWRKQREALCHAIKSIAWHNYHQRITSLWGCGFIGDVIKWLIAHEQTHLREACTISQLEPSYDQWGD